MFNIESILKTERLNVRGKRVAKTLLPTCDQLNAQNNGVWCFGKGAHKLPLSWYVILLPITTAQVMAQRRSSIHQSRINHMEAEK